MVQGMLHTNKHKTSTNEHYFNQANALALINWCFHGSVFVPNNTIFYFSVSNLFWLVAPYEGEL